MNTWWIVATASELVWLVASASWLLFERRSPLATIAWILAVGLLPLIGLVFYFLVGPRRFDRKKLRRAGARAAARGMAPMAGRPNPMGDGKPTPVSRFLALGVTAGGAAGEPRKARIDYYFGGREKYADLIAAIAAARHHVHLEYYIWEPDNIGTRVRDALVERARAGVEVRVLVDGFGAAACKRSFWKPLRDAGGRVARFNALTLRRLRRLANFRTHRKIAVIDGDIGFTGGMNVTDDQTSEFKGEAAWRDTHIKLEGHAVAGLQMVFCEGWHDVTGEVLDQAAYFPERRELEGSVPAQVMASGPDENYDIIHKLFVSAISSARERVLLTVPYFVPDEPLEVALTTAALSGVDVRILVPAVNDVKLVGAAARSYYPELLRIGVRIFEYGPPMLHAKSLVVDDMLGVVGTANADARSFFLNFEVIVALYDAAVVNTLAAAFLSDLDHSVEIDESTLSSYPFRQRLFQNFARVFSPGL